MNILKNILTMVTDGSPLLAPKIVQVTLDLQQLNKDSEETNFKIPNFFYSMSI
jgi:hypothetical protein